MLWTTRIKSPAAVRILYSLQVFENGLLCKIHVHEPEKDKGGKVKPQ
jgi:hypothetical protein